MERHPRGDGDESRRHQIGAGVARERGQADAEPGAQCRRTPRPRQEHEQRGGLERQGRGVGGHRVAVAREDRVRGQQQDDHQREPRAGPPAQEQEPEHDRRHGRGDREQLRGAEQVVEHGTRPGEQEGIERTDEAEHVRESPIRRDVAAVLDLECRRRVAAIEVGLDVEGADAMRSEGDGEQGHGERRDHRPRGPGRDRLGQQLVAPRRLLAINSRRSRSCHRACAGSGTIATTWARRTIRRVTPRRSPPWRRTPAPRRALVSPARAAAARG